MNNYIAVKMMLLGLICAFNVHATPTEQPAAKDTLSIADKISKLERDVGKIERDITPDLATRNLTQILVDMPVTAQNIGSKIQAIQHPDHANVAEVAKELEQTKKTLELLDNAHTAVVTAQNQLATQRPKVAQLVELSQAVKQLLENPINQAEVPNHLKASVPSVLSRVAAVQTQYTQWEQAVTQDEAQLEQAKALLVQWHNAQAHYLNKQYKNTDTDVESNRLIQQKLDYENQASTLHNQLEREQGLLSTEGQIGLQKQIDQLHMQAWLVGIDIALLDIMKSGQKSANVLNAQASMTTQELEQALDTLNNTLDNLKMLSDEVEAHYATFQKNAEVIGKQPEIAAQFNQRIDAIAYQKLRLGALPKQISGFITEKNQADLFTRQSWLNITTLDNIKDNWAKSFVKIGFQIKISIDAFIQKIQKKPVLSLMTALASLALVMVVLHLVQLLGYDNLEKTAKNTMESLGRLRYLVAAALFILILVRFSGIASPSNAIIRLIIYTVLGLCVGLVFLGKEAQSNRLILKFARQIRIIAVFLAAFILLYGLSLLSGVHIAVTVWYEKMLMLSIILATVVLYRTLMHYLKKEQQETIAKHYQIFLKSITVLPWVIIGACVINLVGYNKLAWLILPYFGILSIFFIMLSVGFMVVNQLRKRAKMYSIKRFERGVFIAQDIVSPVSFMLKAIWLFLSLVFLFRLARWDSNSYLIAKTLKIIQYPLVSFGETAVSLQMVIIAILAVYFVFLVARWLKSFSYHWLFAKISDLGIRNSLSIFAQYVIILTGVLIVFKILGFDLTSLAVFAGALGVGIGLGLQDIAKNFISGILLLIERPLRSGDWVVLDGSEGHVKSIGMRAITVETFDKQEVIVPNGNAINSSFTNYTHSNTIVRTVLYVGAGYSCEPEKVIAILDKTLKGIPDILSTPAHKIIMWEYADSSINYRIQYFIDVSKSGIFDVRTETLSAIWYAFEEHNIEIPFPQRDINFRNDLSLVNSDREVNDAT